MGKLNNRKHVEKWLLLFGHLINKSAFEREANIKEGVIQKFIKYDKKLNEERIKKLNKLIKKITSPID